MRYVKEHTTIPVPEIYDYNFSSSNIAGAPYMFMNLVEGMSMRKWLEENTLTKEKCAEFYTQLAGIMWQFYQTRFDKIGELRFDKNGNVTVGGFFDSRTRSTYGPFTDAQEFLLHRQMKNFEYRVLAELRKTEPVQVGRRHWGQLEKDEKDVFISWLYRRAA